MYFVFRPIPFNLTVPLEELKEVGGTVKHCTCEQKQGLHNKFSAIEQECNKTRDRN